MRFKEDKTGLSYQLRQLIYQAAVKVVGKRAVRLEDVVLEHPAQLGHGDYSTNIAFKVNEMGVTTPFDLANEIVNAWRSSGLPEFVAKIEVAPPGFINIWLTNDYLGKQLNEVLTKGDQFGTVAVLKGKKILLEHTSPNPQTTIMLGHLRNNFLGMASANILEFFGAKVTKDCLVNDRGVHICRAIWGYLVFGRRYSGLAKKQLLNFRKITNQQIKRSIAKVDWRELLETWAKKKSSWLTYKDLKLKSDHTNLIWYVLGSRAYELSKKVEKQVEEILLAWEAEGLSGVRRIWRQILDWSAKGYAETYKRVGSIHDWVWYESDHWKEGKKIAEEGLKRGVFRRSEGAVVTDLAKYSLPDAVIIKSDGTTMYHTQDLALCRRKRKKFPADWYIWDIGEEQALYFKQLFAMCEQLGIGRREKFFHLKYALINFKGGGKMATRGGDVVVGDEALDELHRRALAIIKSSNQELRGKLTVGQLDSLAEKVAVGAIKYSLLKFSRETTIYFDINESLALEGNSGPYLQYTYTRTQSVLKKAQSIQDRQPKPILDRNEEEKSLLRTIYKFPEVILEAGENFTPNLICNFLFDLAQKFNLFYQKWPILSPSTPGVEQVRTPGAMEAVRDFRLALTAAVGQIIKNGLTLLGIETPPKM